MRFGTFRLERYGPFEQLDLPFDATPGRVNLIVAPNGYGKSVIRHAIRDFLFGIEVRTAMSFRFGTERVFLKTDIHQDGATRALVRRKGNGNTLAGPDGTELPPHEASRLFGGTTEKDFQELFGLDTALLRSGGQELIRSQGRLGEILFAAGGGMAGVRTLLAELERKRDDLGRATVRHKARPLWSALSNWDQANTDLRRTALRPDGWLAMERQARDAADALQALLTEQAAETRERDGLRTISACRPWLDRLRTARETIEAAADAPDLDDTFEKRWRDALTDRATAVSSVTDATAELASARNDRTGLTFDPAWIAAEADIDYLAELRGEALSAERDLPKVAAEVAKDLGEAARLRHDLGWDTAVPLPPTAVVKDAQRRLQSHAKRSSDAAAARDALADADHQHRETLSALESLPPNADLAIFSDLTAVLRGGGDPAVRLETARRTLTETEAALRTALAAIPDCKLSEAALTTTAAPSDARLEAAGKALSSAEAAHQTAVRDHAAKRRAIEAEHAKLATLERTALLPPPDALVNARSLRDALWIRLQAPEPGLPDIVAFDRALRQADDVADTLIRHSQDVATAAAMRDRLVALEADRTSLGEAMIQTEAALGEARDDLLLMARAAGGNARDMATLRAFLSVRATAIQCREARDAAAAALGAIEFDLTTAGRRLAAALGVDMPGLTLLGTVLAEADRRIEGGRTLSARRAALTEQAVRQRATLATAASAATKADKALADWLADWNQAAPALARPGTEDTVATGEALTGVEALRAIELKAAENQRRVDNMRAATALLATKVAALAPLSPPLAALPPAEAAQAFQRHLQSERNASVRCADADRRIEQATLKLKTAQIAAETATRTLNGLRAALRAETDEDAERQLQRSRAVAAARADHAEAQRHLAAQGAGLSIDALTIRAAETAPEADADRIAAIDVAHEARLPLIETARDARTAAVAALEQAGTVLDAAEAAQRREDARAMLSRTAEEALILHATRALLQAALDRQAAGADQPLLARIGAVFRTITGGAQAGVRIEDTKDGQTMVALEADGIGRKSLDQLSEGTCDQLYLALRIAALEDYAAKGSPLPFIADDILQTFDDTRTTETLRALRDLSGQVQVIVLTHHAHVGDLAAALPGDEIRVMRLDG
jgi:uncharacterized protein YhaN